MSGHSFNRLKVSLQTFRGEGLLAFLLRGSLASIALKLFYTVSTLVISIILARILGSKGYGIYSYAFALTSLIAIPAQIGLPTLLTKNVAAYQIREQWGLMLGILRNANQLVVVLSLGLAVVAGIGAWMFAGLFDEEWIATFAWALVLVPLIALGNLRGATLCGLRRVVQGQLPEQLLLPGLFLCFLVIVLVEKGMGLTPSRAMSLQVLAAFIAFAVGSWLLFRALPVQAKGALPEYDKRAWMRSLLPLSFLAGMQLVNSQTDILILGIFASAADVGVYRVAVQGSNLVAFTLTAMNMVLAPNFSRLFAVGDYERLQRIVTWSARIILLTALPVAGIFIIFGTFILGTVFGEEYVRGYVALSILCLGQLVNAGMGSVGFLLNMTGHERDTAAGVAIAAVVNVILNLTLIPFLGINGAATANATTLIVWNIILVRQVHRRIGIFSTAIVPKFLKKAV